MEWPRDDFVEDPWTSERARQFGAALTKAREDMGLSQRRLAEMSDISHTTIARLEAAKPGSRGKLVRPSPDTIINLVRPLAFGEKGWVGRLRARDLYREFMQLAGYGLLLLDPNDVMEVAITGDSYRQNETYAILEQLEEVEERLDRLRSEVQRGRASSRDMVMISAMLAAIIDRIAPEE